MSRFTVVWSEDALQELARIWMHASDRQSVARSADFIDQTLSTDPATKGKDVSEGLRGLRCLPLAVLYIVHDEDRLARVVSVKLASRSSSP